MSSEASANKEFLMQTKHSFHHVPSRAAAFAGLLVVTVVSMPADAQWSRGGI